MTGSLAYRWRAKLPVDRALLSQKLLSQEQQIGINRVDQNKHRQGSARKENR
jgi:hypothetical protein